MTGPIGFCPCGVCDDCWKNAGCPRQWPLPVVPLDVEAIGTKNGEPLLELCGAEFGALLRKSELRDAVCERCSGAYLTRRAGTVCAGCLSPDERVTLGVFELEEYAATIAE